MGTMIPLGSVLGWIFAVLGFIALTICFGCIIAQSDFEDSDIRTAKWVYALALLMLIGGVVLIVRYWRGGA